MNSSRLRQHRQPWAIALVLALLLLTGWGQVHRVLHPSGVAVHALQPTADAQAGKVHTAGHEEGGSLCQLLDHLSQGSAPTTLLTAWAVMPLPQMQAPWALRWWHASVSAPFEARAPPLFA